MLRSAAAGLALVALTALPAWTDESTAPKAQRPASASGEKSPFSVEEIEAAAALLNQSPKAKSSAKAAAAVKQESSVALSAPIRKSPRASVVQTSFQPDIAPVPDRGAGLVLRPFRKIGDIMPYENYEPDPEAAAKDACSNLCPRPQGSDCPECSKDSDGNLIPCPECPWEQELRRIGRAPGESDRPFIPRDFAHIHYCWEPTNLYHNPIYFEDVTLERYGHTRNYLIQPVFSVAKFAVQLVGLPYQMSIYPVWDKQYSLGYYRPGEFVPYKYHQIPLNARAAAVEAGVISGAYFLFAPGVGP